DVDTFLKSLPRLKQIPYVSHFAKHAAVVHVLTSNTMESTLPHSAVQSDTYALLESMYDSCLPSQESSPWDPDGQGGPDQIKLQLAAHMDALKYAVSMATEPLTLDVLLGIHHRLFNGAKNVVAGQLRTGPVY